MRTSLLTMSAAGLLLAVSAARADPSELHGYDASAAVRAQNLLRAVGLDATTQPISVRATLDLDGRLTDMRVVRSSGSPRADAAAETVLRRILVANPPVGLDAAAVILNVTPAAAQATNR